MERRIQLQIVGGIVTVGILAAIPFARSPQTTSDVLNLSPSSPLVQSVPLHLTAESAASPAVGLRDDDVPLATPPTLVLGPSAAGSRLEEQGIPPELPDRYQPLMDAAPSAAPAFAPREQRLRVPLDEPRLRIHMADDEESASPRERTHRVADGDTLERIALRYWQDAALADALFAANRDQLSTPDPLPIGAVLRIPQKPQPTSPASSAVQLEELPAPVRQPMGELQLDEPLVPIPRN